MPRLVLLLPFVLLFGALTSASRAHDPFEITTNGKLFADYMELRVAMNRATAAAIAAKQPDATAFRPEDFESVKPTLLAVAPHLFRITADDAELAATKADVILSVENEVEFFITYPRPAPGRLRIAASHLFGLPEGFGNMANIVDMSPPSVLGFVLLTRDEPALEANVGPPAATSPKTNPAAPTVAPTTQPASTASSTKSLFGNFLRLGIKHILEGYDHLFFLGGLLVVCTRFRSIITIITCFTLAHSVTLALAALNIIVIPGRIVEPLIAASILFVGIENLVRRDEPKGRWLLTLTFGLVHGFGFASILREKIGLGENGGSIAMPLFAFNLGVELGQLAVAAVCLPLLWRLRSWPTFARRGPFALSVVIAAAGGYWLCERLTS